MRGLDGKIFLRELAVEFVGLPALNDELGGHLSCRSGREFCAPGGAELTPVRFRRVGKR
jgi:hypothetical protein